ncbi:ABC transporter substrate-binding protein [Desulfovibrio inopinatus]|uniref:ABC transporter substrate-binding protein n=1 Tax=Desulfovibrio inopinatus TaxID=102109 RepID=UPI0003F685A7|nr:ABC transporter substrate-binding protein [Desulfovibrio inopinatus]
MRGVRITFVFLVLIGMFGASIACAERTVMDQLGKKVALPDEVKRAVVLMHHALDIAIQLDAEGQIVGVLERWNKYLPDAVNAFPALKDMPTPGDLKTINMESLLALHPDIVIVTHYAPEDMRSQIEAAGIPVVGVSLYRADFEQASRLNPKLKDPDKAYTEGMIEGVTLLGEVFGKQDNAVKLIETIKKNRAIVAGHLSNIPDDQKVSCYMANPELHTYGSGKYTGVIMDRAGGKNVAAELDGYQKVNMEDVLRWNPSVIFVQSRYKSIVPEMKSNPAWAQVDAVKNGKIYITPEYVKPWGHPTPESMALGEIWMAKKLYPKKFADVDLPALVNSYYETFYGIPYKGQH